MPFARFKSVICQLSGLYFSSSWRLLFRTYYKTVKKRSEVVHFNGPLRDLNVKNPTHDKMTLIGNRISDVINVSNENF